MSGGARAIKRNKDAEPVSPSRQQDILLGGGIIALAALVAYHNCFAVPFILDDVPSVMENPKIRHLWPIGDALSPSTTSLVGGRPVVNLSLALNYALGGMNAWGYHALNLAIHILAGLTLFGIVRRTLLLPSLRERFGPSAVRLALAAAVLWTVHPLQTEAVTYISQRCESLMGLFYLLTLYCFIRGVDSRRHGRWFTLSVITCLLGMATKEVMVTAPLMVLLYDRTFISGSFRGAWTRHRPLYWGLAGTWVPLGYLMAGLRYRGVGYGQGISWWAYTLTECRVVARYLWLAIWPHPLVFDYGDTVVIRHVTEAVPYALALAILGAGVLFELRRKSPIGFVGAWFFAILAPASSVVPVVGQPMAEHRMYLPLAAVVTLGVMGLNAWLGRRSVPVVLAVAVGLGLLTIRRNQDYQTELSIWNDTLAKCPDNVRAHYNLGFSLGQVGRRQEAIDEYQQALQLKPDSFEAQLGLGYALSQVGRLPEAIGHYQEAVRIRPDNAKGHYNLGLALWQAGQLPAAIGQCQQAVRIAPDFVEAHVVLGIALAQAGSNQDALVHFRESVRLRPDSAEGHYNLGHALFQAGNVSEAMDNLQEALRIKPDYAEAHYNLGLALEKTGRSTEAIEQFEQVLKLRPDFTGARDALARLKASP